MLCSFHITALSCTTVHIVHIWNRLPDVAKSTTTLAQFRARLNSMAVYGLYTILSSFTFLFSFEWCRVCRVPVYELYFPTKIFNIRTNFPQRYFIFYSEFSYYLDELYGNELVLAFSFVSSNNTDVYNIALAKRAFWLAKKLDLSARGLHAHVSLFVCWYFLSAIDVDNLKT